MRTIKNLANICVFYVMASSTAQAAENGQFPTYLGPEGMQHFNIPPSGLYVVDYTNYFHASRFNDQDGIKIKGLDPNINVISNGVRFLSFIDISQSIDARLGILSDITIPFGYVNTNIGDISHRDFGLEDVIINPFSLYRKKGDWLNIGFSPTALAVPTGRWEQRDLVTLGRNYLSWQPTFAYTIIFDNVSFSGRLRYIHNFTNDNGAINAVNPTGAAYKSGNMIAWDFGIGYRITEKIELAANGYYLTQIADDQIHGDAESNVILQDVLQGGRSNVFALGPAISYDFGRLRVSAQWQHQFEAENTAQGDSAWFRIALPLKFF